MAFGSTPTRHLAYVGLALLLLPGAAQGKRKRANNRRPMIAIFPLAPNPAVPEEIRREFDGMIHSQAQAAGLQVLAGVALDHRLRESAAGAIGVCRGNAGCAAKLGKRARVDEVVYASASTAGDGVTIALFVVSPARARIERKASIEVLIKEEIGDALAGIFPAIFKVAAPNAGAADPLAAMGDLDLEPLAEIEPLPTRPGTTPTGPLEDPLEGDFDDPLEDNAGTAQIDPDELVDPLEDELDFGPDPTGLDLTHAAGPTRPSGPPTPWLMYGSFALGGLGIVAAGAGGSFGVQSLVLHNRAVPNDVEQRRADDLQKRSLAAADRANLMYIVGGTLAVIAGVMFTIDVVLFDHPTLSTSGGGATIATW